MSIASIHRRKIAGFTLIELVIAIAVFAVIAALSYGGLNNVLNNQAHSAERAERLARLQMVYRMFEQDFQQSANRSIRNEYGENAAAFVAGTDPDRTVEFTRGGWRNPAGQQRSSLQRVAYAVRKNTLIRESWMVLDRAQDSKARKQKLIKNVETLTIRILDVEDQWQEGWPPPGDVDQDGPPVVPKAVELTLELDDWGKLTWLFRLKV